MSCNKPMKSAAFGNFACGAMIQGGLRLCEDCLRNQRANVEFLGQRKPVEKRDFENLDTRLYLSLKKIMNGYVELCEDAGGRDIEKSHGYLSTMQVLKDFEDSHGPIPEWAIARNFGLELTLGAQLFTKNGRRSGNGWLVNIMDVIKAEIADKNNPYGEIEVYTVLTEDGSYMRMTKQELEAQFEVGDWICTLDRIASEFDRHGIMKELLRG